MNDFMAPVHYEFDYALRKSPFEKWAEKVESIIGRDLDGDQTVDGFSLDYALVAFEAGNTPQQYASSIKNPLTSLSE